MASIREARNKDSFSENLKEAWKSLQRSSTFWGAILYGWFSLLGMLYARSYYQSFEIDIFSFVELSDFLLMTLSKAGIVLGILLGILFVLVLVTAIFRLAPLTIIFILFSTVFILFSTVFILFSTVLVSSLFLSLFLILITLLLRLLAKSVGSYAAWDAFTASRREWKPFTVSFRAAWDAFTASHHEWKALTESLRTEREIFVSRLSTTWKPFTKSLRTEWKKITDRLDTTRTLQRAAQEKCKSFFWRSLFVIVTATVLFGTFFMPSYYGEQDARALAGDSQINRVGKVSVVSIAYGNISEAYRNISEGINCLFSSAPLEEDSQQKPQYVRVTIRQDAGQSNLPMPDHTLLLGTTSSFHFFYEYKDSQKTEKNVCAKAAQGDLWETLKNWGFGLWETLKNWGFGLWETLKNWDFDLWETLKNWGFGLWETLKNWVPTLWNTSKRENAPGRPFIVPTANIASLEFAKKLPPYIDEAITRLDTTIDALKLGIIQDNAAIIQTNKTITLINEKNSVANIGIEQIEKLEPDSFTHVDQIVAVVTIFKSYLEDYSETTIADLNEKIATFNSTCGLGWEEVTPIGPFCIGKHDQVEGTAEECLNQLGRVIS